MGRHLQGQSRDHQAQLKGKERTQMLTDVYGARGPVISLHVCQNPRGGHSHLHFQLQRLKLR